MNSETVLAKNEVYGLMEAGKPYASYIKTILGQVAVTVWDAVLEKPVDIILHGDPRKKDEDSIVKVWDVKEDSFFKRMNRGHFKEGRLVVYTPAEHQEPVKTIEQASDDELKSIINQKYMGFISQLNKIETIPVLFRMLGLAQEMEKSEKITSTIEKRISELQTAEYVAPKGETEED